MGFSEKQEELVKESWEIMKEDIPSLSLYFFTQVLEIAPGSKRLFSFLKDTDEIPQNNPKLKSHAIKVFKMTCESAIQLREKGEVVVPGSTLKYMGSVHLNKGIAAPHFEVVKEGLLRTVEKGVGEKWCEDMKGAWSEAYDQLAAAILAEMNKEAAEINKEATEINKEAAEINKEATEINKEAAEINKEAAEINKEAAEINKEAAQIHS